MAAVPDKPIHEESSLEKSELVGDAVVSGYTGWEVVLHPRETDALGNLVNCGFKGQSSGGLDQTPLLLYDQILE